MRRNTTKTTRKVLNVMNKSLRNLLIVIGLAVGLVGCGGSVKRPDGATPTAATGINKFNDVKLTLNDEAQKQLVDNLKFDLDQFGRTVRAKLTAAQLVDASAAHTIGVTITGVRVRSSFSAVMFGALAGADSVDGDVNVLDKDGKVLRTFKVSASYAFGGFGGGIDSVRLNYLYEKFADLTAAELSGTK